MCRGMATFTLEPMLASCISDELSAGSACGDTCQPALWWLNSWLRAWGGRLPLFPDGGGAGKSSFPPSCQGQQMEGWQSYLCSPSA